MIAGFIRKILDAFSEPEISGAAHLVISLLERGEGWSKSAMGYPIHETGVRIAYDYPFGIAVSVDGKALELSFHDARAIKSALSNFETAVKRADSDAATLALAQAIVEKYGTPEGALAAQGEG